MSDSDYDFKKLANERPVYNVIDQYGKIYSDLSLVIFLRHNQSQTLLLGSYAK